MKPDDPVCRPFDIGYSSGGDEPSEELIQHGHEGRVAFQRRAANYMGVAFGDVAALRRYARIFTRQECWEDYGQERARDQLAFDLKCRWYFAHASAIPEGMGEGYYYDGIDPVSGDLVPVSPEHLALLKADDPEIVPDDWEPSETHPAWTFTDRHDVRGFPVLIAEEM